MHRWEGLKSRPWAQQPMSERLLTVLLVFLLLPFASVVAVQSSPSDGHSGTETEVAPAYRVAGQSISATFTAAPTVLHLGGDAFDPLALAPSWPGPDGLAVVQFHHVDGHRQQAVLSSVEATVLDHLDPASSVVRLQPGTAMDLNNDPSVRWLGAYDEAWRVDARLASGESDRWSLVVADDLRPDLLPELVLDLLHLLPRLNSSEAPM